MDSKSRPEPESKLTGFDRPTDCDDSYVLHQYQKLGLGENPTLREIEPVAIQMMEDKKFLEAAGLVLGRRVDAQETREGSNLAFISLLAFLNPNNAFGFLLLQRDVENPPSV